MFLGLLFAVGACFVWGGIFVIPDFLNTFTGVEVVLGRYLTYGLFSSILLFRSGFSVLRRYSMHALGVALLCALFANLIYYFGLVAGIRLASAPLTVLVAGLAPILIAIYGNWSVREIAYRHLIIPCLLIVMGITLVNVAEVDWSFKTCSPCQYALGMLGAVIAVSSWAWYAVYNARFLKKNPHIPSTEWATVIGVGTFIWTLIIGAIFALGFKSQFDVAKIFSWSLPSLHYLIGTVILGVVCSWLGCFLWNLASFYLPVSLMGPLLIFETIFGLTFVFFVHQKLPTLLEFLGFTSMIGGIALSMYVFRRQQYKQRRSN